MCFLQALTPFGEITKFDVMTITKFLLGDAALFPSPNLLQPIRTFLCSPLLLQ